MPAPITLPPGDEQLQAELHQRCADLDLHNAGALCLSPDADAPLEPQRSTRRGHRLIEAPGDNRKVYGFGLVDWRDGWVDGRRATGRTAAVFCEQVRAALARSKARGRVAIIIADHLQTHTAQRSLLVRSMLTELSTQLFLVYTPASAPDATRIAWRCAHLPPHRHP